MGDFLVNCIKVIVALLLIPIVVAGLLAFYGHLEMYPAPMKDFFSGGMLAFLITFLFLYQFWGVFEFGQKIMTNIFKFLSPLDRIVSYLFPFYVVVVMILFFISTRFVQTHAHDHFFVFFVGFALTMHWLLVAQELQQAEKALIKPNYLLLITVIFIFNLCLTILLFDLIQGEFSFPSFVNETYRNAKDLYTFSFEKVITLK